MSLFRIFTVISFATISTWKISDFALDVNLADLPFVAKLYLKTSILKGEGTEKSLDNAMSALIDNGWSAGSPEVTKLRLFAARHCMKTNNKECIKRWLLVLQHVPHIGEGYSQEVARKRMLYELREKLLNA